LLRQRFSQRALQRCAPLRAALRHPHRRAALGVTRLHGFAVHLLHLHGTQFLLRCRRDQRASPARMCGHVLPLISLLLLLAAAPSSSQCFSDCRGRGSCSPRAQCECFGDFEGADCSKSASSCGGLYFAGCAWTAHPPAPRHPSPLLQSSARPESRGLRSRTPHGARLRTTAC
jgi:hypothetical protein